MASKNLPPVEWQPYFERVIETIRGRQVRVEVLGSALGVQVLAKSLSLLGITYEPKRNARDPVRWSKKMMDFLLALEILERDDRHQILTLGRSALSAISVHVGINGKPMVLGSRQFARSTREHAPNLA